MALNIALDIGGTFTDMIIFDESTGEIQHAKSSTTPYDLAVGIEKCLRKSGVDIGRCESFVHGSTIAINTVIELKGGEHGPGHHPGDPRCVPDRPGQQAGVVQYIFQTPCSPGPAALDLRGRGTDHGRRKRADSPG